MNCYSYEVLTKRGLGHFEGVIGMLVVLGRDFGIEDIFRWVYNYQVMKGWYGGNYPPDIFLALWRAVRLHIYGALGVAIKTANVMLWKFHKSVVP